MRLNADFSKRVVVLPDDYDWADAPADGVQRMMLDRVGGEVARATSLVRFAANATFPEHTHGAGEEFFVLEGAFGDEHEIYPAGTYVRNPAGTSHSPRVGGEGCLIFVKLRQFDDGDQAQFAIDTGNADFSESPVPGVQYTTLHKYEGEHVALVRWAPDTHYAWHEHDGGEEVLVLEGAYYDKFGAYPAGSWIRSPHGSAHEAYTKEAGALIYVKTGHLPAQ